MSGSDWMTRVKAAKFLLCVLAYFNFVFNLATNYHRSAIFLMPPNVEGMQRAGFRGYFIIHRYCPC